ncbi:hypothetical protein [Occallatibacter riparius]|uniref:Uncharacterized protein n=1 Tax=Occallatibacter riparius TaxID=1002689 RepID=A0A9J7BNH5_9BACT|nr:hypothetical protein [Occallatibacter riparius]UWZ83298.1 hypothetical protein MOP44_22345 [Occallatibacter riparius]
MKTYVIALALCGAGLAHAQSPSTPPAAPQNPDQLFKSPLLQPPGKPQFKLQVPDSSHRFFTLPQLKAHNPAESKSKVDPGILRKPQGFAQRPSRPAPRSDIYPGLKIQPTQIALLETPPGDLQPKSLPIPTLFPNARFEPIPINWHGFKMIPVETGSSATP